MKNATVEDISLQDRDFIRLLAAMPTEAKILTRGVILGLNLSEKIRKEANFEPTRNSA